MIPLFSLQAAPPPIPSSPPPPMVTASHTPSLFLTTTTPPPPPIILPRIQSRFLHFPIRSLPHNNPSPNSISSNNHQPRTVFPGGFKRPQLKLPCIVLCLYPDDVLSSPDSLDFIDTALSMSVGIVVLHAGPHASGNRLYQAACLLKSVVRDRAFLLIGERVDIAAAVNATGVLLSDQGLPTIVARNMMMDSKPDSVLLPLVGRNVQSPKTALTAAKSEGADFLIYNPNGGDGHFDDLLKHSGFENVKIPIFTIYDSNEDATSYTVASKLLTLGCSGFVMSLGDLRLFTDSSLNQLFNAVPALEKQSQNELQNSSNIQLLDAEEKRVAGFLKLKEKEKNLIETERSLLLEAISFIQKAVPMMEEVSLLIDAVSQIDEPFLLAIVGEFNSGKSSVINALLGKKYLKEGVVPTTNEITFLRYSKYDAEEQQRCERHPDGQFICYLPAPILKGMNIVDTPGTNVILQRQQRLTEEFVPRADLLLFVISADRPLTESEVSFLRYTQQWKKKVVFVLNKSDLYQNSSELEEAISFIKENTRTLLNAENVTLYPVSARSALEAKLSASSEIGNEHEELNVSESHWKNSRFCELEKFLYSFLDGATRAGRERMKLKLETPIAIAERLLSSCETLVKQDIEYAEQDLISATKIVDGVKGYAMKMENESISWRRRTLSLIDTTKSRVVELVKSTLQLSNLDLVASYIFRGGNSATMPATIRIQNDIMGPALSDAQKLIGEYVLWVQSNTTRQGKLYKESFEKRWPTFINPQSHMLLETYELLKRDDDLSLRVINDFSASATSKLFEQEIREVFLGTFGGLGAAGLSASLLTSVLPTTLEDLLALGLCSTGGYVAILNFPARRQKVIDKVNRIADGLAREVEEAMQKDLLETVENLEKFVTTIGKPYQDAARQRLDKLVNVQEELSTIGTKIRTLQVEIQNLHVS